MSISATKLNGVTLPQVASYSISTAYVGGAVTLASGQIRRDLMNNNAKRRISLAWVALTGAELATIEAAYHAAVQGDVAFVGPDGMTCNVNAGTTPGLNKEAFRVAGGALRWRCSFELWEA